MQIAGRSATIFYSGLYYHPYIEFEGEIYKYGIMSADALIDDLKNWRYLYASARLMNPHLILDETVEIKVARKVNQEAAFRLALLLMKNNVI